VNWKFWSLQILLAVAVVSSLVFAARISAGLSRSESLLQANTIREPQSADPLQTFVEVALPPPAMPLLSAGFQGVAPSLHLVRLNTSLPLANVDQIENPARRRHGRVDLAFILLYAFPLALLAIGLLVAYQVRAKDAAAPLLAGKKSLLDFAMEHVGLPLAAWLAFSFAALLAALYANGLRLDNNESILRFAAWIAAAFLYSLCWLFALLWFLLRTRSLERSVLAYSVLYGALAFVVPSALQSLSLAIAQPEPRLALTAERRLRSKINSRIDPELSRRLIAASGSSLDFATLSPRAQQVLTSLALEQQMGPRIDAYLNKLRRYEQIETLLQWTNPVGLTHTLMDDLAGTGLRRYASFREQVSAYSETWRRHMLPKMLRQEALDFDALRAAPRFRFEEEPPGQLGTRVAASLLLLSAFGGLFAALAFVEWRRQMRNATR
jgi:ABC-2 type transport system permease protein